VAEHEISSATLGCMTEPEFGDPRLPQRFWDKIEVVDTGYVTPCWLWTASLKEGPRGGYGRFGVGGGKDKGAHRVAYEALVGPIPDGEEPDHRCEVKRCTRPTHLESVTHQVNMARALSRDECPANHPYTGHNLIIEGNGWKRCRICRNARKRRRHQRAILEG